MGYQWISFLGLILMAKPTARTAKNALKVPIAGSFFKKEC